MNHRFVRACDRESNRRVVRAKKRRAMGIAPKVPQNILYPEYDSRKKFRCKKCGVEKPHNTKNFRVVSGRVFDTYIRKVCRLCEAESQKNSLQVFLKRTHHGMRRRVEGKTLYHKGALGKELCGLEEFLAKYAHSRLVIKLWETWRDSGYALFLTPSIDRVDSTKGYSLENIQWLAWQDHVCKTKYENMRKR